MIDLLWDLSVFLIRLGLAACLVLIGVTEWANHLM